MTLAGAGRPDEVQDLGAVDELELGERHDAVLIERRLEGEVEAGERLDGGEPRHDKRCLDAAVLAQGELLGEQGVDGFERGHLTMFEPAHCCVEDFDGARHLEGSVCVGLRDSGVGQRGIRFRLVPGHVFENERSEAQRYECLWPEELFDILQEFRRIAAPDSVMRHTISLDDQYAAYDSELTQFNLLHFSNRA